MSLRHAKACATSARDTVRAWRIRMNKICWTSLLVATLLPVSADDLKKPLVLASQGGFFVGGATKTATAPHVPGPAGSGAGDVTINQMLCQFQTPIYTPT